jgi:hypothetical protein
MGHSDLHHRPGDISYEGSIIQGTEHTVQGRKIYEETIRDTSVRDGLSCQRQGINLAGGSCNEPLMTLHFLRS